MCTVLLPPGGNQIAVNKHIIYHTQYLGLFSNITPQEAKFLARIYDMIALDPEWDNDHLKRRLYCFSPSLHSINKENISSLYFSVQYHPVILSYMIYITNILSE